MSELRTTVVRKLMALNRFCFVLVKRIAARPAVTAAISVFAFAFFASAGSLTPPGAPGFTMARLSTIWGTIASDSYDSSGIIAKQNGSLFENLKYIESQLAWASNSNNVWLLNSGNVGIGDSTPEAKFEVVGTASASRLLLSDGDCTTPALAFSSENDLGIYKTTTGTLTIRTGCVSPRGIYNFGETSFSLFTYDAGALWSGIVGLNSDHTVRVTTSGTQRHIFSTTAFTSATNVVPSVNNTYSLGTSALRWSNLFATNASISNDLEVAGAASVSQLYVGGGSIGWPLRAPSGMEDSATAPPYSFESYTNTGMYISSTTSGVGMTFKGTPFVATGFRVFQLTNVGRLSNGIDDDGDGNVDEADERMSPALMFTNDFGSTTLEHQYDLSLQLSAPFTPSVDSAYSLGTSALRWSNLFAVNVSVSNTFEANIASVSQLYIAGSLFSGRGVTSDSLDFDEFVNAMTLDAATTIASNGYKLGIDSQGYAPASLLSLGRKPFSQGYISGSSLTPSMVSVVKRHTGTPVTSGLFQTIWDLPAGGGGTGSYIFATQTSSGSAQNMTGQLFGVTGVAEHVGTGTANVLTGIYGVAQSRNASVVSTANAFFANFGTQTAGGTVGVARGFYAQPIRNNGTSSSSYGFYAGRSAGGSGAIVRMAGLAVEHFTEATNNTALLIASTSSALNIPSGNWGIYDGSPYSNYFAGNVGIGTQSVDAKFELVGFASISGSASISGNFELSGFVSSNLTPRTTDTFDLGTSALRWRDLYLASGSLHIGTAGDEAVIGFDTTNGGLTFAPNGSTTNFTMFGAPAAGGSGSLLLSSATLNAMNGSDTMRGLFIDLTNADHTGSSNTLRGLDVDTITGDAQASEYALYVGSGWDRQFYTTTNADFEAAGRFRFYPQNSSTVVFAVTGNPDSTEAVALIRGEFSPANNSAGVRFLPNNFNAMDGNDTARVFYIDLDGSSPNHTGTNNTLYGFDAWNITGDVDAMEIAFHSGTGWDLGLLVETNASISNNLEVSGIASVSQLFVNGVAVGGGAGVTSNSLDFDEFVDAMTLDANLTVASAGYTVNWEPYFASSLSPSVDDTYALGAPDLRWRDLYVGPGTIHIGASGNEGCFRFSGGQLEYSDDCSTFSAFSADIADGWTDAGTHVYATLATDNVGIGTTTSLGKLTVRGSAGNNQIIAVASASGTELFAIEKTGQLTLSPAGSAPYVILTTSATGGNVGIGNTTPTEAKLVLRGTGLTSATNALVIEGSNGTNTFAYHDNGTASASGGAWEWDGSGASIILPSRDLFAAGNIVADFNQQLGIGFHTYTDTFGIFGGGYAQFVFRPDTYGFCFANSAINHNCAEGSRVYIEGVGSQDILELASASGTVQAAFKKGGELVIGNAGNTPTGRVTIYEDNNAQNGFQLLGMRMTGGGEIFQFFDNGASFSRTLELTAGSAALPSLKFTDNQGLFDAGTNILGFTTAGVERMRIDAAGNVGIGTTTTSAARMAVMGGNVGIGTTTAGALLDVNGDVIFRDVFQAGNTATASYSRFGTGTTGHGLTGNADLLVSDDLEVNGVLYADNGIQTTTISGTSLSVSGGIGGAGASFSGNIQFGYSGTGVVKGPNGSAAAPAYTFTSAMSSGMYYTGTDLGFSVGGTQRATITSAGYVNAIVGFSVNGTPGDNISCGNDQYIENISVVGGIITGGNCQSDIDTPDIAEAFFVMDDALEAGDLVTAYAPGGLDMGVDGALSSYQQGVVRSTEAHQAGVIGVVSTNPAMILGAQLGEAADVVPVALAGRVPVKVTTEHGAISVGDRIVASDIPGVGMRASQPGMTVGVALEPTNLVASGSIQTVIVLISPSYWVPSVEDVLAGTTLDMEGQYPGLFAMIVSQFANLLGIEFGAGSVSVEKLCVGAVCVTEEEFMKVFGAGVHQPDEVADDVAADEDVTPNEEVPSADETEEPAEGVPAEEGDDTAAEDAAGDPQDIGESDEPADGGTTETTTEQ